MKWFLILAAFAYAGSMDDFTKSKNTKETILELRAKNRTGQLPKKLETNKAASVGGYYAGLNSPTYDFYWAVVSGGWYWEYDETTYATFYEVSQKNEDFATYEGYFYADIYQAAVTPIQAAQADVNFALGRTHAFTDSMKQVTFAGQAAYKNLYSYLSTGGTTYACCDWYFAKNSRTYSYQIYTTVTDWNLNNSLYMIIANSFGFNQPSMAKINIVEKPFIQFYPNPFTSGVTFDIPAKSPGEIFIYDLHGKRIRSLTGNTWDGRDVNGNPVSSGVYISNIKTPTQNITKRLIKQ